MPTINPAAIVLSKVAPWNPRLRADRPAPNAGKTQRFAMIGERRFRVERTSFDAGWWVEEVDAEGDWIIFRDERGEKRTIRSERGGFVSFDFGWSASVATLAQARERIAAECSEERDERAQEEAVERLSAEHGAVCVLPALPDGTLRAVIPDGDLFRIEKDGEVNRLGYADFRPDWNGEAA
jgi:hypothetical protein